MTVQWMKAVQSEVNNVGGLPDGIVDSDNDCKCNDKN